MRLDKYLKTARILKRREAAKELALQGRITVNGRRAKPGTELEIGDVLVLKFGNRCLTVRITDVKNRYRKALRHCCLKWWKKRESMSPARGVHQRILCLTLPEYLQMQETSVKTIEVVCGALVKDGRVLIARRVSDVADGWYEFPGGKIEPGETAQEALIREWQEEMGIRIRDIQYLASGQDQQGRI